MLDKLLSHESECEVKIGGVSVTLTLRPFTLGDLAFMQKEFPTEQSRMEIAKLNAEPLCKIVWHMLTPESKDHFSNIRFTDYDEEKECIVDKKVTGYKKLFHSIEGTDDLLKLFTAYSLSESLNNFIPDVLKKKAKN